MRAGKKAEEGMYNLWGAERVFADWLARWRKEEKREKREKRDFLSALCVLNR